MVVRRNMTVDWFLPGGRPPVQQQQAQNRDQPPPTPCVRKRPLNTNQPPRMPEETPPRTPPAPTMAAVVIREPASGTRPTVQVGLMCLPLHPPYCWIANHFHARE